MVVVVQVFGHPYLVADFDSLVGLTIPFVRHGSEDSLVVVDFFIDGNPLAVIADEELPMPLAQDVRVLGGIALVGFTALAEPVVVGPEQVGILFEVGQGIGDAPFKDILPNDAIHVALFPFAGPVCNGGPCQRIVPRPFLGELDGELRYAFREFGHVLVALKQDAYGQEFCVLVAGLENVQVFECVFGFTHAHGFKDFPFCLGLGFQGGFPVGNEVLDALGFQVGEQVDVGLFSIAEVDDGVQGQGTRGLFPGDFIAVVAVHFEQGVLGSKRIARDDKVSLVALDVRLEYLTRLEHRVPFQFQDIYRGAGNERSLLGDAFDFPLLEGHDALVYAGPARYVVGRGTPYE